MDVLRLRCAFLPLLFVVLASPITAHAGSGGPDAFGYTWVDNRGADGPDFEWVEIGDTGRVILDDHTQNGVALSLDEPWMFYGGPLQGVYVSVDGYVSSDPGDGGQDGSNDCGLPAPASSGGGARIYALHDNLELDAADGRLLYQYLRESPHPHHSCGVHVITWEDVQHNGSSDRFSFQLLLFDNFDMIVQVLDDPEEGALSTTGIQNFQATLGLPGVSGLQHRCNNAGSIPGNHAVLFQPPASLVTRGDDALAVAGGAVSPVPGTLRHALLHCVDGGRIAFDSSLAGQTIVVDQQGGPIRISAGDISVDASALSSKLTLDGDDEGSILKLEGTGFAFVSGIAFERGRSVVGGFGGAIEVRKDTMLCDCDLVDNRGYTGSGREGGAIALLEGRLLVRNCEFSLNYGEIYGGAIWVEPTGLSRSLVVQDSSFFLNESGRGGAIAYATPSPYDEHITVVPPDEITIEDSTFSANEASSSGGALYFYEPGTDVSVRGCLFIDNGTDLVSGGRLTGGGAIYWWGESRLAIEGSTFTRNNRRGGEGAALWAGAEGEVLITDSAFQSHSDPLFFSTVESTITGSSFWDNDGNVLENSDGAAEFVNCTFSGNSGGLNVSFTTSVFTNVNNGEMAMRHCTFADNRAPDEFVMLFVGGETSVSHSLFSGHQENTINITTSAGHNVSDVFDSSLDHPTDATSADVRLGHRVFASGARAIHIPQPGSEALDIGVAPADAPAFDQRGKPRSFDGDGNGSVRIDAGAVELAGVIVVDTSTDEDNGRGAGAGTSLREALADIDPGGLITFADSLSGSTIDLGVGLGTPLEVVRDMDIDASALDSPIKISGSETTGVFVIEGAVASLTKVWTVDGKQSGVEGSGLRVVNGAEVSFQDGRVLRCRTGASGGGVYVGPDCELSMSDSKVSNNATTSAAGSPGGGIYVDEGAALTLRRCAISNNSVSNLADGGGIYAAREAMLDLRRSTVSENSAGTDGGGLYLDSDAALTMENCTISTNSAGDQGGGMYLKSAPATISHSTIVNNRSELAGGGIYTTGILDEATQLWHTILAANRRASGLENLNFTARDDVASLGYNLIDSDELENAQATDLVERKPFLAPLAVYGGADLKTHPPLAISPAIDTGTPYLAFPAVDQRGFARLADGSRSGAPRLDIGAVEAARPLIVTTLDDNLVGAGPRSLREAISLAEDGGRIVFARSLSGGAIRTATSAGGLGTQFVVDKNLQIDATRLPAGIKINAGDESRIFRSGADTTLALHAVTLNRGSSTANGGAIYSLGTLVFTNGCIVASHADGDGGGIASESGTVLIESATLSGNDADDDGGAIALRNSASGVVRHATLFENSADGSGGGVWIGANSTLTTYSSAYGSSTGSTVAEAEASLVEQLVSLGYNLNDSGSAAAPLFWDGPGDISAASPVIDPLVETGGWGCNHPLGAGNPQHNLGDPAPLLLVCFDQRGRSRIAGDRMDIGATEVGGHLLDSDSDDIPDWWEELWGLDPDDPNDAGDDPDLDGDTNLAEFQNDTDPTRAANNPMPTPLATVLLRPEGNGFVLGFSSDPGVVYIIEESQDLKSWEPLTSVVGESDGNVTGVLLPQNYGRGYFRVVRQAE